MGMHSWFEGQGAWHGGLTQRGNVPKELIVVDFREVTICPTCMKKGKHCVGSRAQESSLLVRHITWLQPPGL